MSAYQLPLGCRKIITDIERSLVSVLREYCDEYGYEFKAYHDKDGILTLKINDSRKLFYCTLLKYLPLKNIVVVDYIDQPYCVINHEESLEDFSSDNIISQLDWVCSLFERLKKVGEDSDPKYIC